MPVCLVYSDLLVPGGPDVVVLCRRGGVLGHDAHQGMGRVEFLQPSAFLRRQSEIHRPGRVLDMGEPGRPNLPGQ